MTAIAGSSPAAHPVSAAEKVSFLKRPEIYPDPPQAIETVETHMSWVFLGDRFAYKLKKPVLYDFVDFRSLESRRVACEDEVRLNRRLAPLAYIGPVPLVVDESGGLRLDGKGVVVDWVVHMRRLPASGMLDIAIAADTLEIAALQAVAAMLARFFGEAVPVAMPSSEFRKRLADSVGTWQRALQQPETGLPMDIVVRVADGLRDVLATNALAFDRRIRRGRVIEGHGDLRPQHIFLGPAPAALDCLEYDRDLRILDWADELALLAMECEMLGSPGAGKAIAELCAEALDDSPPDALSRFYKAYRAMQRARIMLLQIQYRGQDDRAHWLGQATAYLKAAAGYIA